MSRVPMLVLLAAASALAAGGWGLWALTREQPVGPLALAAEGPPAPIPAPPSDKPLPPLVTPPDLTTVERRLREPPNLTKPGYGLLVFGDRADTPVWVVVDGDKLYVDRDADGVLADADAVPATEMREFMTVGQDGKTVPYRQATFAVGDVTPRGRAEKHTRMKVSRYQEGDEPANYVVSVWARGTLLQYAGWGPLFTARRDDAPVVHFGGPVQPKSLRGPLARSAEGGPEVHFCVGTPGLGKHSFAYVGYESVPKGVRPVVEVAWPGVSPPVRERFELPKRC